MDIFIITVTATVINGSGHKMSEIRVETVEASSVEEAQSLVEKGLNWNESITSSI